MKNEICLGDVAVPGVRCPVHFPAQPGQPRHTLAQPRIQARHIIHLDTNSGSTSRLVSKLHCLQNISSFSWTLSNLGTTSRKVLKTYYVYIVYETL